MQNITKQNATRNTHKNKKQHKKQQREYEEAPIQQSSSPLV